MECKYRKSLARTSGQPGELIDTLWNVNGYLLKI